MKYIKVLGLAAIAAMALIAFVGASSASATVLCTRNLTSCPEGHSTEEMYEVGDIITGTSTNATLSSDLSNVICEHSETVAEITSTGGSGLPVEGEIIELNFSKCHTETALPTPCKVEVVNLPYLAKVVAVGGGNGELFVSSGGSGSPGAAVTCAGIIECTFTRSVFELPVTGGNPASITANEVPLNRTGGLCGTRASWNATYKAVGTNTAIWVVS